MRHTVLTLDEQLLYEALAIYSPSGQEQAVSEYLAQVMRARGLNGYVDEVGNAVGEIGHGHPHLMLLGHIDTVPGFIPVRIPEGAIYGRGAVDAKGPFVAFICAVARLAATRINDRRITLVGAVEEEAVTSKGARYALNRYQPDYVIIGEPSGWDAITLGYKGRLIIHYSLARPMSHTASRERAPAEEAVVFWQKVQDFARSWNEAHHVRFGQWGAIDPSLRHIVTSDDPFVQKVEARFALRLPLSMTPEEAMATIAGFADSAMVSFSGAERAVRAEKTTPLVRSFLAAIRQMGGEPRFKLKTGTSDMNIVAAHWHCPIVAYGPGDSSLDHTPNEHLDLSEYARAIDVVENVLKNIC